MTFRTESRLTIAGNVHQVWAYLCDVGRWPEWAPTVLEGQVRGGGPLQPGARLPPSDTTPPGGASTRPSPG